MSETELEPFVKRIYDSWTSDASDADRIGMLPHLSSVQIEQLTQLICPTYDGNVISKSVRSELCHMNLAARWNGLNFITQAGVCVLDTLGILGDHSKFCGGLKRARDRGIDYEKVEREMGVMSKQMILFTDIWHKVVTSLVCKA